MYQWIVTNDVAFTQEDLERMSTMIFQSEPLIGHVDVRASGSCMWVVDLPWAQHLPTWNNLELFGTVEVGVSNSYRLNAPIRSLVSPDVDVHVDAPERWGAAA